MLVIHPGLSIFVPLRRDFRRLDRLLVRPGSPIRSEVEYRLRIRPSMHAVKLVVLALSLLCLSFILAYLSLCLYSGISIA